MFITNLNRSLEKYKNCIYEFELIYTKYNAVMNGANLQFYYCNKYGINGIELLLFDVHYKMELLEEEYYNWIKYLVKYSRLRTVNIITQKSLKTFLKKYINYNVFIKEAKKQNLLRNILI